MHPAAGSSQMGSSNPLSMPGTIQMSAQDLALFAQRAVAIAQARGLVALEPRQPAVKKARGNTFAALPARAQPLGMMEGYELVCPGPTQLPETYLAVSQVRWAR